ncbi:hypothetical protein D6D28_04191 [Aureobasidium pullulans]|uniref:Uncharacterized protein n=1 Tax=Aureobasidium pullulans TaxID=5580 RepID=A0A4S8SMB3_AURPU|nr:hypothetical protein D6D28_04191 [Aureobasidium pullulans]
MHFYSYSGSIRCSEDINYKNGLKYDECHVLAMPYTLPRKSVRKAHTNSSKRKKDRQNWHVYGWFVNRTPISGIKRARQGGADALPEAKRQCTSLMRDRSKKLCVLLLTDGLDSNLMHLTHACLDDCERKSSTMDFVYDTDSDNALWNEIEPLDRITYFSIGIIYPWSQFSFGIDFKEDGQPKFDIFGSYDKDYSSGEQHVYLYARMEEHLKGWACSQGPFSRVWLRDLYKEIYSFKAELEALARQDDSEHLL